MGLMLFLEAISLYGQCQHILARVTSSTTTLALYISDHYYHLTTPYWVVFTLFLIATILVLAVSQCSALQCFTFS